MRQVHSVQYDRRVEFLGATGIWFVASKADRGIEMFTAFPRRD